MKFNLIVKTGLKYDRFFLLIICNIKSYMKYKIKNKPPRTPNPPSKNKIINSNISVLSVVNNNQSNLCFFTLPINQKG